MASHAAIRSPTYFMDVPYGCVYLVSLILKVGNYRMRNMNPFNLAVTYHRNIGDICVVGSFTRE